MGSTSLISTSPLKESNIFGNHVFQSFTHYFELLQNKRFQTSTVEERNWIQIIDRIRNGNPNNMDLNYLKSKCVNTDTLSPEFLINCKVLVSINESRVKWNTIIAKHYARLHEKPIHFVYAKDKIKRANFHDPASSAVSLRTFVSDSIIKDFQHTLILCKGGPVVILSNLYKSLGVTNGSTGVLHDVIYNSFNQVYALLVKMPNATFKVPGLPVGTPDGTVVIERATTSDTLTFLNQKFKVVRSQFPISEGFAFTAHKGYTLISNFSSRNDYKPVNVNGPCS